MVFLSFARGDFFIRQVWIGSRARARGFSKAPGGGSIYRLMQQRTRWMCYADATNTPRESFFSLPSIRYFRRHSLPPDGCTNRNDPNESPILNGFSRGFAFRMAKSVNGMSVSPAYGP